MQLLQSKHVSKKRHWRRRLIWLGVVALAAGAWLSLDPVRGRYRIWKQQRALEQAKGFIEKRDARNAQIALEVALNTVPGNTETLRVAADMLEQVGSAQAMRIRRAVVQVVPDSLEDMAKLVLCCLKFRDFNAAKDALSGIPRDKAGQPVALRAALAFALATGNSPVADVLFQQLESELPQNSDVKLAHAVLYLRHPNEKQRQQAQRDLEGLMSSKPALAPQIHREFVSAALERRDYVDAKKWLALVLAGPTVVFSDRLQSANLELLIDKQPFEPVLARLAPMAGSSEIDAAQFVQWLLVQGRAAEADRWLGGVTEVIRQSASLKPVRADLAARTKNWDLLGTLVAEGAWGPISSETVRLAMAAQTVDTPSRPSLRHDTWDLALASAGGNFAANRVLQRLAAVWQWDEESERTLWNIARTFPAQTWAHQELFNVYRKRKNTAGMRDVTAALRDSEGSVPRYQHDWALLTLLLEPSNKWNPAKDIMRSLYEADPGNATFATGYAYALAQAGKAAEALAVVEKMTPMERDYPLRQPYLAFIYGVARKGPDYERTVTLGQNADFLPEENYLFTRGKEELARKPERPKAGKPPTSPAPEPTPKP